MEKYLVYASNNGSVPLYENNKVITITDPTKIDEVLNVHDNLGLYFHISCPIAAGMHKDNMQQKVPIVMDKYSQNTTKFKINSVEKINKDGSRVLTNNLNVPDNSLIFLVNSINQSGGSKITRCYINYD